MKVGARETKANIPFPPHFVMAPEKSRVFVRIKNGYILNVHLNYKT